MYHNIIVENVSYLFSLNGLRHQKKPIFLLWFLLIYFSKKGNTCLGSKLFQNYSSISTTVHNQHLCQNTPSWNAIILSVSPEKEPDFVNLSTFHFTLDLHNARQKLYYLWSFPHPRHLSLPSLPLNKYGLSEFPFKGSC